jgi:hypothetical protein
LGEDANGEEAAFPLYACRTCGDISEGPGTCNDDHPPTDRVEIPAPMDDPEGLVAKALEGVRQEYDTEVEALDAQSEFFEAVMTEGLLSLLDPPDGVQRLTEGGRDAVERLLMFWVQVTSFDGDGGINWMPTKGSARGVWRGYVIDRSEDT